MATADSTRDNPMPFPSGEECARDRHSVAGRIAREVAYVEAFNQHGGSDRFIGIPEMFEPAEDRVCTRLRQARALLKMLADKDTRRLRADHDDLEAMLWLVSGILDAALGDALIATGLHQDEAEADRGGAGGA